ncbi:MAG TPA: tetratricopeptide repeat protein [Bryobacteraceae bacterium]|nr:tetratricopeptide repeat protein [Bryobacteraceae bacterium]
MASASPDAVNRAEALYHRTEYQNSLKILSQDRAPDFETWLLTGKNYFMLGDFKKATDLFEKCVALDANSSEAQLWLGRSWGRRAENSSLMAVVYAKKAHQAFEKSVALDPNNNEARNDLFDYYLNAPAFLGGGVDKAEALARGIAGNRPVEHEFEQAQIAEKRNDLKSAEEHLRRAMELAPRDAGRIMDLARFLAKHGRFTESDELFERARKAQPDRPGVNFAEAKAAIDNHRNLDRARTLLRSYVQSDLTPDDPSRQEAEKLLKRAGG